ncbi:MAG: hypothetical protein K2X11_11440 [Acetobacteraceae bacterium]|nr:hypothetical protein [Acetobacteraceae bacterium]
MTPDPASVQAERLDAAALAVGKLAHDVNNTLTVMLGNAEYLLDALADRPDLLDAVRLIVEAAERAAEVNRRVLLFSRRRGWNGGRADLGRVLDEARALELPPGVSLQLDLPPSLPPLALAPNALAEAVNALLRNAIEAMPDGGTLRISAEEEPSGQVTLRVQDTGRGMDAEELARCLEPFASRKPGGTGVGLGLAIAHGVARAAGGKLSLRSRPGEGTEVRLTLPSRKD